MLLMLAKWIGHDIRLFNVFNYITLRGVLAALTALIISFIVGPWMIRLFTPQSPKPDTDSRHDGELAGARYRPVGSPAL